MAKTEEVRLMPALLPSVGHPMPDIQHMAGQPAFPRSQQDIFHTMYGVPYNYHDYRNQPIYGVPPLGRNLFHGVSHKDVHRQMYGDYHAGIRQHLPHYNMKHTAAHVPDIHQNQALRGLAHGHRHQHRRQIALDVSPTDRRFPSPPHASNHTKHTVTNTYEHFVKSNSYVGVQSPISSGAFYSNDEFILPTSNTNSCSLFMTAENEKYTPSLYTGMHDKLVIKQEKSDNECDEKLQLLGSCTAPACDSVKTEADCHDSTLKVESYNAVNDWENTGIYCDDIKLEPPDTELIKSEDLDLECDTNGKTQECTYGAKSVDLDTVPLPGASDTQLVSPISDISVIKTEYSDDSDSCDYEDETPSPTWRALQNYTQTSSTDCTAAALDNEDSTPDETHQHACPVCNRCFLFDTDLQQHLLTHTDSKPDTTCHLCERTFSCHGNLRQHMKLHARDRPLACLMCKKRFARPGNLRRHMMRHVGKAPHHCQDCNRSFSQTSLYIRHLLYHAGEQSYSCSECEKNFPTVAGLNRHMLLHTGGKFYQCPECDQVVAHSASYKYHLQTHLGEKSHVCPDCGKRFSQTGHLRQHMMTHTGEKPFACPVCSVAFSEKGSLKRHMVTHTGERPHICPMCGKCFTQAGHVKQHMRTHTHETPYACRECDKSYKYPNSLVKHMQTHESKPQCDDQEPDESSQSEGFQQHMSAPAIESPNQIQEFKDRFNTTNSFQNYLNTQNEGFQQHMSTPVIESPNQIQELKNRFNTTNSFQNYINTPSDMSYRGQENANSSEQLMVWKRGIIVK